MKKRFLSLLVVMAILFTSVDMTVFAQPTPEVTQRKEETKGQLLEHIEEGQEEVEITHEGASAFSVSTVRKCES